MTATSRPDPARVDPRALDLGHLALFVGLAFADKAQAELAAAGFAELRFSHGFVIQHLIGAERTIGELATRLQVTQQAASKAVVELEALGYVERFADEADARVRRVRLTARGQAAVTRSRKARAALQRRLVARHGEAALAACQAVLADVLDTLGGADAVRSRRVLAPR
ncbi:MarR family winged helix-turn-helix transcriptional regulator [Nannocystis pusilla]|uniref:MarR family winged helix-turn-helix transcriptional regulator n=1 Tax=Nannocystis pusilla TaxID=889268 RepID=UPI003DA51B12